MPRILIIVVAAVCALQGLARADESDESVASYTLIMHAEGRRAELCPDSAVEFDNRTLTLRTHGQPWHSFREALNCSSITGCKRGPIFQCDYQFCILDAAHSVMRSISFEPSFNQISVEINPLPGSAQTITRCIYRKN